MWLHSRRCLSLKGPLLSWALAVGRKFTAGPANYNYFIFLSRGEAENVLEFTSSFTTFLPPCSPLPAPCTLAHSPL